MTEKYSTFSLQKRLLAIIIAVTFIFLLLVARLGFLQIVNASNLLSLAQSQWTRSLPCASKRGTIYDRNGVVLAESISSYNVYIRASNVTNPNLVASTLSGILNINYDEVYIKATNKKVSESLVKLQVNATTAKSILNKKLDGVYLSQNSTRVYPFENFLSQVLGYTTIDNIGQSGIELYYNKYLSGIDGESITQTTINGQEIFNTIDYYIPSIDGCNIYLTLDYQIQKLSEEATNLIMQNEKPKSASVIVMNAKTAEIIAMSTKPSFDLNNIPRDNIIELNEQSKNKMIVDVYEPGSTFKVLTTAMALESNLAKTTDGFYDPGYRIIDGERINCWKLHGHGQQTLVDGLCNSCNSVFLDLALRLGKEKLYDYFEKFGFGNPTGIDFAGESGGIVMDYDYAQKVDYARMGFGQAIATTPIQLIRSMCAVLNGGNLMKPYFTSKIVNSSGKEIIINNPEIVNKVISEQTSSTIRYMLEEVIKKANGITAFIPGYRISGKTGTSQKYENGSIASGKFTSSFCGAFPADDPKYVVLVIVDEPTSGAYYGSIVATPYAKTIFEGIIQYENFLPNDQLESDLKRMTPTIPMPNLVGKSLTQAVQILHSLNLQYELDGDGGIIIEQLPVENTLLYQNAIVLLKT